MTATRENSSTSTMRHVALLLVAAFAVRIGYSALVIWAGGSFETIDSGTYLAIAQDILATGEFARLVDGQVVPITDRMPTYVSLLAAIIWLSTGVREISPADGTGADRAFVVRLYRPMAAYSGMAREELT